jgi:hypothetical protein
VSQKIQNGREIQDGRQTIKCSRFAKKNSRKHEIFEFCRLGYLNNMIE